MIKVTEQAAQLLKELRIKLQGANNERQGGKVLRLIHSGVNFGIGFDFAREGDHVIQSEGTDILVVGADLADVIPDATIDCQDTPEGPRLVIAAGQ